MKRILCILLLALSVVGLFSMTAFAASPYTVDKVDVTVDLRSDGSALVTEEWTVTVAENCEECFTRNIAVSVEELERFSGISDLSVSLDGNVCMEETGDVLRNGTYFYTESEDMYSVNWYIPQEGQHVFAVRYIQGSAVRLYKDRAYYYFCAQDESGKLICRNVTIKINTPADCFAENFEIVESGSLAGEKTDGRVTFFASNAAGVIKTGIAMPQNIFDVSALAVVEDNNSAMIAVTVICSVLFAGIVAVCVYITLKYKIIFRNHREKKCKKKIMDEPLEKLQRRIFENISPAQLLHTVLDSVPDESDYFTVTALELYQRGYITASNEGFDSSEKSMTDHCGRKLDKNEKRVIRLFDKSRWQELISSPEMFYNEISSFNKNIKYLSPVYDITAKGRKLIERCFELKLNARRTEYITPQEISDSFFKNTKYTTGDLVIAIINEQTLSEKDKAHQDDAESFVRNLFMFRDVYSHGRKLVIEKEAERKLKKKNGDV